MNPGLRLLLVDDHALVRAGLRSLLHDVRGIEVVAEAGNGRDALRLIEELHPEIVLMDISMPVLNGFEAARRVVREHPQTRVLMISMHADEQYVSQAFAAGAMGYLLKSAEPDELQAALDAIRGGQRWLSRAVRRRLEGTPAVQSFSDRAPLTPRQREVLQLIAEGNSTRDIAQQLRISVKTVETHRAQLMDRLGIRNVPGLVLYAIRAGIVQAEP
ncbi:MAG: response regulator [Myxococcales bacterium]